MARRRNVEIDIDQVVDGMLVVNANITFAKVEVLNAVKTFYRTELQVPSLAGQGFLAYVGHKNAEGSVFLGSNPRLGNHMLAFFSQEGVVALETFRENFLNLETNKDLVKEMTFSNILVNYNMPAFSQMFLADFQDLLENTVRVQQKTLPRVSREQGILYLGGKSSATALNVKGLAAVDLSLRKISLSFKLKGVAADNCFGLMAKSIEASYETIIAYLILKQLGRVTLSEFLTQIRNELTKNYTVGQVAPYAQREARETTPHGKYILRALAGIRNKLFEDQFSIEAQVLLMGWLYQLVKNQELRFKNKQIFVSQLRRLTSNANIHLETILRELNSTLSDAAVRTVVTESGRAASPPPATSSSDEITL